MAARGVRLDPSAREHLDAAINGWLDDVIGARILADAKHLVHKKTSRLHDSLMHEVHNKVLWVGSLDCNYSVPIEMGSPRHDIFPKTKKALFWPGAAHPVGKVDHPGNKPYPYLRPALFQRRTP